MTLTNRLHGYSFKSKQAKEKVAAILAFITAAPDQRANSKQVREAVGLSATMAVTYLHGMHMGLMLIKPVDIGSRGNIIYGLGEDPELETAIDNLGGKGERRVVRRKASESTGPVPVDPMRQFLFGR